MEVTGTFKHQKVALRKEGFDINAVKEPIYWLNPNTKKYEKITEEVFALLSNGKAKL